MGPGSCLGPRSRCYNPAKVTIGERTTVSQDAELCTASHDFEGGRFQLFARPISIEDGAWVAAKAFIGPGVEIGKGAVVGACAVVFRKVPPNIVVVGNPAEPVRERG